MCSHWVYINFFLMTYGDELFLGKDGLGDDDDGDDDDDEC